MLSQLCTFFSNNAIYEDSNALSFGANYNSVAQKLRILAIFKPKNPFLANLTIQLMFLECSEFLFLYYIQSSRLILFNEQSSVILWVS